MPGRDAFHGDPGGPGRIAFSLYRPDGLYDRFSHSRKESLRDRGFDRFICEHPGVARRSLGRSSFNELIDRVRKVCVDAYSHDELPFEKLVEELRPARDMSYSPLFQLMFAFQNMPATEAQLPELNITPLIFSPGTSMFDLTLFMWEDKKGLSGKIEYSTDLFDAGTIERVVGNFLSLIESAVAAPGCRLSDLSLLTDTERRQILVDWNDTYAKYPRDKRYGALFEEQAARTPDDLAVICAGNRLTYRDLNARADLLANYLRSLGAKPDDIIGVYAERSLDMVVALLGILKSGCRVHAPGPRFSERPGGIHA